MLEQELAEQSTTAEASRLGMEEANKGLIKQMVKPLVPIACCSDVST